jgi:2-methylcitrate dehydratase PrpD
MAKSFHPGRSAQSGYIAALLAQEGFTAGPSPLEGPRGFAAVTAGEYDLSIVTDDLGRDHLLGLNTYKPFACGIVIHPTIDACLQIHAEGEIDPAEIEKVELRVAPLVLDLCNQRDISTGLEGKFSIYHAAAHALAHKRSTLAEFTDEAVNDPRIAALRAKVTAVADASVSEDGVVVALTLASGAVVRKTLDMSIGNIKRPLSDARLEAKFRDQATVLAGDRVDALIERLWSLDKSGNVGEAVGIAVP